MSRFLCGRRGSRVRSWTAKVRTARSRLFVRPISFRRHLSFDIICRQR
ncbi:hypothetical protein EVA_05946 [gut metagenome]|uniref:Uncharacterized protein n=1 Tax=gut metagenome TaxID=749906 RepID=J9GF24_9ZZZZ